MIIRLRYVRQILMWKISFSHFEMLDGENWTDLEAVEVTVDVGGTEDSGYVTVLVEAPGGEVRSYACDEQQTGTFTAEVEPFSMVTLSDPMLWRPGTLSTRTRICTTSTRS